ncbi:MAG TPA: gamma-glutamyltransferase [candidate division Zixibacteria bacterium]|nr:gamma-glutamyltransferase [candidate division Zixibacteria bacterium]
MKKASVQLVIVLALSLFVLLLACSNQNKEEFFENGALATAAPIATDIGVEVFKRGGNAFDVAVAVGFALAVVHPEAGNIGGGGFAVIRDGKTGEIKALDFREKAPLAAHEKMYLDSSGNVIEGLSTLGALSCGVPGTVAGLYEIWKTYGTMEWKDLIGISAVLADSGFVLDEYQSYHFKEYKEELDTFEETSALFFPSGMSLEPGERIYFKDLSRVLSQIAAKGPTAFYQGEIADSIVATMKRRGGIISKDDLTAYTAVWREPIHFKFDSLDIYSMPPPSSGGLVIGEILKILEPFDFSKFGPDSIKYIHLFCEAARLAYADRSRHLGDPDYHQVPGFLLDDAYLTTRRTLIDPNHANSSKDIQPGSFQIPESKQTTHFSVADKSGNIVALTYTLNSSYGSKLVVRGCGFLLNNEMDDFAIAPGHANLYGLVGGDANKVEPGKRMLSSMSPTIVLKNGTPFLTLGSPGGSEIITSVAQVILNCTRFEMSLQESINYPRFHHQWLPDKVEIEQNSFNINFKQGLIRLGHNIEEFKPSSEIHAIYFNQAGLMSGGADPRGRGTVGGF